MLSTARFGHISELSPTLTCEVDGAATVLLRNPIAVFTHVNFHAVAHKLGHLFRDQTVLLVATLAVTVAE